MKKLMVLMTGSAIFMAMVAVFCYPVVAAVSGPCSDCHTMHNSQGGATVVETSTGSTDPQSALLVSDCLGCHTTSGTEPLVDGYPYVKSSGGSFNDDNCLAGGFFQQTDSSGNNDDMAHSIDNTNEPAGYTTAETDWYTGLTNGLGCAGTNGCHGNQTDLDDMAAISGGHHDPSAYRILYVGTTAVGGSGAVDYEADLIDPATTTIPTTSGPSQNVNIYSADTSSTLATISELCAKCHGDFHNETGSTADTGAGTGLSPWIRHPSDAPIPDDWDIDESNNALTASDYKNNPVGYLNFNDSNPRMATCLSCHRAHGTENQDLLRWAYTSDDPGVLEQNAGSDTTYGCLGCHDQQRDS